MKKTDDEILAKALDILARDIQSEDGVANEAIREAAQRLRDLRRQRNVLWCLAGDAEPFLKEEDNYPDPYSRKWMTEWLRDYQKVNSEINLEQL